MFSLASFFVFIILLIYVALLLKNTTVVLLVFVMTALFVISFISMLLRCIKVRGSLQIPIEISEKGRENLVKIQVINKGKTTIPRAKVRIIVKDLLTGRKRRYWRKLPVLAEGENEFVESLIFYEMGRYEVVLGRIRLYDITGFMHGDVWTRKKCRVQVMPGMWEVPVIRTEATRNFYGEAEIYDEHLPGYDNSEIFQMREYQRGDRLQNVHWKLTAKHDELIIKEHSLPRACPVVIYMDFGPGVVRHKKARRPYMEAVAALSFSMMNAGCPHYIVWFDKAEKDIVRVRVDNEESLFYFIGILTDLSWGRLKGSLQEQYRDKYRSESYVREYTLDKRLELKEGQEVIAVLSARNPEKSLSEIELVL